MDIQALPKELKSKDAILALPAIEFDLRRFVLPTKRGIYFILYEFEGRSEIAYLGITKNLNKRWIRHHRIPEINVLRKLSIPVEIAWYVADVEDDNILKIWERILIQQLNPPLNYSKTVASEQQRIKGRAKLTEITVSAILQDYFSRLSIALSVIQSDEVWEACNDDDGDLNCLWIYPDGYELVDVNYLFMHYEDAHPVCPSRVPYPPAFSANTEPIVVPNKEYEPSMDERLEWVLELAELTDSWLCAVAGFYSSKLPKEERAVVFKRISESPSLRQMISLSEPR